MATAAAIAAAAIGAAGSVAGGVLSSQGASKAAKAGKGSEHRFPLPPYQHALEQYYTRLLASNLNNVAPSFGSYVASGGAATFPMHDTGFTPQEARDLRLVGPRGGAIPFVGKDQTALTPEQELFIGSQQKSKGAPLGRAYHINQRIARILENNPDRQALIERLRGRRDRLLAPKDPGYGRLA